jgi:ABC-2 type transport system permease protein
MMNRLSSMTRSLVTSGRLGWAVESNWTDPFVFMTYQIVRPLFGAFILVVMFKVVTGQPASAPAFAQVYVGNAMFMLVIQVLFGLGIVIYEDRERFEMLRYIYLAPVGLGLYLTGRGLAKALATTAGVVFTLLAGSVVFGITYHMTLVDLPYLTAALVLGMMAILAVGVALAGVELVTSREGFGLSEGVASVLYLLSGAVFTIDILPRWMVSVGHVLPFTYWLEALRRSLLHAPYIRSLTHLSDAQILLRLSWTTAATVLVCWATLAAAKHYAIASGKLDQRTDH